MFIDNNYIQKQIKFKTKNVNGIIMPSDYYVPIMLKRNSKVFEYVDTKKDEKIYKIERQFINPYFIEYGFFDNIGRIKVNYGNELSNAMIEYIKTNIIGEEIYNVAYMEVEQNSNSQSPYYQRTGIAIGNNREKLTNDIEKIYLSGTVLQYSNGVTGPSTYDGEYDVQHLWIDANNNIGGLFCQPYYVPFGDSFNTTVSNYGFRVYSPPSGATVTIIRSNEYIRKWFDNGGREKMIKIVNEETRDNEVDKIDKIEPLWTNVVSKSKQYLIDINK